MEKRVWKNVFGKTCLEKRVKMRALRQEENGAAAAPTSSCHPGFNGAPTQKNLKEFGGQFGGKMNLED